LKDGVSPLRLTGGSAGTFTVSGEAVAAQDGGSWTVTLTRLDWFSNWANGWTQASFLLDGTGVLAADSGGWTLKVDRAPQLDVPESAAIRYFDTYVRDEKGLAEFSHRWDRIQAVCAELKARLPQGVRNLRDMERYLFPEVYGYEATAAPGSARVSVFGIEWDSDYTKDHFSEPLRALRDSGTLFRDYRESPGLWSLALAWQDLWGPDKKIRVAVKS
jgi:hypothetical protein